MRSPIATCSKDKYSLPTGPPRFAYPPLPALRSAAPQHTPPARAGTGNNNHDKRPGARQAPALPTMPGLVAYSGAGLGLLALAALESLPLRVPPLRFLPRRLATPLHLRHLVAAALSSLCLVSALVSAHHLSLPTLAASALFLLYSLAPFAPLAAPLPFPLLDLLLAAAFAQELLLFAHRRPSTAAGIENRYFDLLLVPIALCLGATLLAAHRPGEPTPRLARAAGLALQGTWMLQMGFSFFTSAIAQGCALHAASRADYTIKCRTHEDYHRARSVATLQFNGHLALLVISGAAAYAAVLSRANRPPSGYSVLGKEVQMEGMPIMSQFTLDSDEEKEDEAISSTAAPAANGAESHDEIPLHEPGSK